MPIKPQDAALAWKLAYADAFDAACKRIDKTILEGVPYSGEWWFNVKLFECPLKKLVEAYTEAGWDARIEHDWRDGDALVISKRRF